EARLYHNVTSTSGHWLEVDTVGTLSNSDGCGAVLRITAGGRTMIRQVFCGGTSLASGSDSTVHVGLGDATTVDEVSIIWPSGVKQVLANLPADQLVTAVEPAS